MVLHEREQEKERDRDPLGSAAVNDSVKMLPSPKISSSTNLSTFHATIPTLEETNPYGNCVRDAVVRKGQAIRPHSAPLSLWKQVESSCDLMHFTQGHDANWLNFWRKLPERGKKSTHKLHWDEHHLETDGEWCGNTGRARKAGNYSDGPLRPGSSCCSMCWLYFPAWSTARAMAIQSPASCHTSNPHDSGRNMEFGLNAASIKQMYSLHSLLWEH